MLLKARLSRVARRNASDRFRQKSSLRFIGYLILAHFWQFTQENAAICREATGAGPDSGGVEWEVRGGQSANHLRLLLSGVVGDSRITDDPGRSIASAATVGYAR
jgi:hypothetical protein